MSKFFQRIYFYLIDYNFYSYIKCSEDISVKDFLNKLELKINHENVDSDDEYDDFYIGENNGKEILKDIHCVYLKGNKLDEQCLLKNYSEDLEYIPLIITRDPNKLIENSRPPINIDDYTNLEFYKYLIKATDNKTNKNAILKNFNINDMYNKYIYLCAYKAAITLNHDGIVKILGIRYPLNDLEKTKTKLLRAHLMNKDKKIEFDLTKMIIVEEFVENGDIEDMVNNYLKNKGKNDDKMIIYI